MRFALADARPTPVYTAEGRPDATGTGARSKGKRASEYAFCHGMCRWVVTTSSATRSWCLRVYAF